MLLKECLSNKRGLTLIELLVIIVIIGILMSIALVLYNGYISNIEEKACMENRLIIKRSYELYLYNDQLNHTSLLFDKFLLENNYKPIRHDARYVYNNEEVICSHHDEEDVSDDEAPYL